MDPVATAFTILKKSMEAFDWAQKNGFLGGSTSWEALAADFAGVAGNFASFAAESAMNPGSFDNLDETQIRAKLHSEGWAAKEARILKEMGG